MGSKHLLLFRWSFWRRENIFECQFSAGFFNDLFNKLLSSL